VGLGVVGTAIGVFAVTNVDDLVVLTLFFGQGFGHAGSARRIAVGQYLGFAAILAIAVSAAFGATFLPDSAIAYLGLVPIALGLRSGWKGLQRTDVGDAVPRGGPRVLEVAAVTFANGGDNIGVYVPLFATAGVGGMGIYTAVFLVLLAGLILTGRYLASRPLVAKALEHWDHIVLPVVLIGIGLAILISGHAFGW
jgi:cadmium resistance protein CadD (predicted permease)